MSDYKFPTEVVDLPSKGYFYPESNPLSSGKVEMKYMTAREEDILTSPNLLKSGLVLDKLLESLIIDKKINCDDLLIGDKNGLIIAARILAYGKDYAFEYTDDDGTVRQSTYDLTTAKHLIFNIYYLNLTIFTIFNFVNHITCIYNVVNLC